MSQNDSKEKKYILKASDDPKKIDSNFSNKSAAETVKNNINIFSNKNISHDLNTDNKNENNKLYKCLSDGNPRNNNNTIINDFKKQYDPDNILKIITRIRIIIFFQVNIVKIIVFLIKIKIHKLIILKIINQLQKLG